MRKFNWAFVIMAAFILVLGACGTNDTVEEKEESTETTELAYEPEAIDSSADVCDICAMSIEDGSHATQIVLENDRTLKFDDLGCLYGWIDENGEDDIGAKFVRDFNTEEWIEVEEATYVFDEAIETPMSYGIISFENSADAEAYIEENDFGELLELADLDDHKWEMMDHDHDHDHDDGHED